MRNIYVLIACECSQAETIAFRARGFYAYSCDIEPVCKYGCPRWHIQGDVSPYLHGKTFFKVQSGELERVPRWDMIIAHPPCTYLTKIGAQHLYKNADTYVWDGEKQILVNGERWESLKKAKTFFMECLNADAPFVAVENPIPMRLAQMPAPSAYADPSWFGSRFTKKTLYWLRNLPPLMAEIQNVSARPLVNARRGKYRSVTDLNLANAIARQWGDYITVQLEKELSSK